jgi:hypothetical protein
VPIRTETHLPSSLDPGGRFPSAYRSKAVEQLLLEMIPAIKVRAANLVNNRKKRERCENPD